MEFKKYNSIENSYRQKFIDMITINPELMKQEWFVHEKIHGANFAIYVYPNGDTAEVIFAKRSGFIKDDEKFYSLESIKSELNEYGINILKVVDPDFRDNIVIRGELFGGGYDHSCVEKMNVSQVQKGIQYSPKTEFMAFDLEVDGEIVDWDIAKKLLDRAGVPTVPFLRVGTFEVCIGHSNTYKSFVPSILGLPELEDENICEGNVIKPNKAAYFPNGSRVILKNKNEKFTEKSKVNKKSKVILFSDEMNKAVENMDQYINDNRLSNVLSHIGVIKQKDFGKVCGLFAQDVILDYLKDYEPLPEKKDWKLVTKQTSHSCAMLLRQHWLDILDGDY